MNKFEKALQFIKTSITKESEFYQKIYLVGGCVRDELLGERFTDLDLLVNMPDGQKKFVEYMCATFPEICKGPFYYKRYGTTAMDVIIDGTFTLVECVEPHIEQYNEEGTELLETHFCSLEEDSKRRDYTCNALYKNLHTGEAIDPSGMGIADLKAKYLRTPGEPHEIYKQDPVRMLRGIRFKHQKNFQLDPDAWNAIVDLHDLIVYSAPTRMREEVHKMVKSKNMAGALRDLYLSGLMPYLFPGLEKYFDQEMHAAHLREDFNVWGHTKLALNILIKEHPYTDTMSKLVVLFADIAIIDGIEAVEAIIQGSLLGKEKTSLVIHTLKDYLRFRAMFKDREYIGRARTLPHFIVGLGPRKNEFRRLVRALNHGMMRGLTLPYELLYDDAKLPSPKPKAQPKQLTPEEKAAKQRERNRRKHQKAKDRRKAQRAAAEQSKTEE